MTSLHMVFFGLSMILIVGLLWGTVTAYNNFILLKKNVHLSFANIDVLMKQRHDELPKLIQACRKYMGYEQETLNKIVELRNQQFAAMTKKDIHKLGEVEYTLQHSLGKLFALSENYPELKANESFLQLQSRISFLESGIKEQRESYNDSVTRNNIQINIFPENMVAVLFRFKEFALLEFVVSELEDVDVSDAFKKYDIA